MRCTAGPGPLRNAKKRGRAARLRVAWRSRGCNAPSPQRSSSCARWKAVLALGPCCIAPGTRPKTHRPAVSSALEEEAVQDAPGELVVHADAHDVIVERH